MNARVQRDPQSTDTSLFVNAKKNRKKKSINDSELMRPYYVFFFFSVSTCSCHPLMQCSDPWNKLLTFDSSPASNIFFISQLSFFYRQQRSIKHFFFFFFFFIGKLATDENYPFLIKIIWKTLPAKRSIKLKNVLILIDERMDKVEWILKYNLYCFFY